MYISRAHGIVKLERILGSESSTNQVYDTPESNL
jgi:hypothetical protein